MSGAMPPSQDVDTECGEHLRDLHHQVVAVRPGQGVDLGIPTGIEEERKRKPAQSADIANPMRRGAITACRHALEHVTDVADERIRHWCNIYQPARERTWRPPVSSCNRIVRSP